MTLNNVLPLRGAPEGASFQHALVKGESGNSFLVQTGHGLINVQCALGCLVRPRIGDRVLISSQGSEHFILTVLSRSEGEVELYLEGDASIRAQGRLRLAGNREMELQGGGKLRLGAAQLELTSASTRLTSGQLNLNVPQVEANHDDVQVRARSVSVWAQRLTQRVDTLLRMVETVETARIGQLVQTVRQAFTLNAQHAVITARKDVKIDGERIHMG